MSNTVLDSYALDQAVKMARTDLASYHKAREQIHKDATKNLVLVPLESPKPAQKRKASEKK